MSRKALIAAALIAGSLSASAHSDTFISGRVVGVVPHLSLSFGSLRHDGFRVEYESGGRRHITHSHRHPGHVIHVPNPRRVVHKHRHVEHRRHARHDDRRHGWRDGHHRDERRHARDHRRESRDHGRHEGRSRSRH